MPYVHGDDEAGWAGEDQELSPDVTPRPSGPFDYEPAEGTFEPDELDGPAQIIYAALIDAGAKRFRVRYDGGHDEGFAHADTIWFGPDQTARGVADVAREWATSPVVERIGAAVRQRHPDDFHHTTYAFRPEPEQWVDLALWELAEAIASALLGEGYGTGEYSLYGALVADLETGDITDDPAAAEPPSRY
jgi:hypothetical protein